MSKATTNHDAESLAESIEAKATACTDERVRDWVLSLVEGDRREREAGRATTPAVTGCQRQPLSEAA